MVERVTSRAEWRTKARKAESLGYKILSVPDHFGSQLAYGPILAAAAAATTTIRIGTFVLDNDFRHPAIVAADAAMLDLLSDGRFELGIGAGWLREDYDRAGIPFDRGTVRFNRLTESVRIIKGLFTDDTVAFVGEYYAIADLHAVVQPVQRPHPPVLIGGGGRRLLTFAAQEADIVSIIPRSLPGGGLDETDHALDEKLAWIRQAAGGRFDTIELKPSSLARSSSRTTHRRKPLRSPPNGAARRKRCSDRRTRSSGALRRYARRCAADARDMVSRTLASSSGIAMPSHRSSLI